jgi:hypothetical protein
MSYLREPNAEPIPGYRLIAPLGSGGFGEVWKCEAPGGIVKAMKFVYGNLNSLDVDAHRAEQELHALQRIRDVRHPFVCSLDRIEIVGGELVIVMELAEKTLHDLFLECQAAGLIGIPRDDLLRYLRDAAEALDHMNEKHKLQHLDVKPRNLFLISDRVKVADFGLVKHLELLSGSGLLGGVTPLYAAPETFNGKISDRSDQYSLAIVYQELLTGHRPYVAKNVRQMVQAHLESEPDVRALPEAERSVVQRALAKDPAKRFPSCMAFVRALYTARHPARKPQAPDAVLVGQGHRPKSMAETLDDIMLDDLDGAGPDAEPVPPRPPRGADEIDMEVSQLGVTVVQPQTGALRPTVVVGVGSFGRKALLELRCRFLDRFGDLSKIPLLRFLCLDADPEAVHAAVRGAPEVALSRHEVYHLPLQPVGNYRRRSLDHLCEWLPREKLYAMPRSLQTQGSRALGRLAFVDNQQRLLARLRREIQEVTNPDALYQSVSQTGLALRDNTPRVYVLASAGGGGSGLLTDLGYALRRLLVQTRHPDAELTLLLCCGAPTDPATPKPELANVYATLTELNHYSDPSVPFAAQYGVDGQRIVDHGMPFGAVYLLPLAHRSPQALEETVAHLGSYLFHEVTTPLGLRLDHLRHQGLSPEACLARTGLAGPFRSFGTFAVWFPRGLLLRLAARLACRRIADGWLAGQDARSARAVSPEIAEFCQGLLADPELQPVRLVPRIEEAARGLLLTDLASSPAEALTGLLAQLEEQSSQLVAQEDPGNWSRQALNRVKDWVGGVEREEEMHDWRKTRLNRTLTTAAQTAAVAWGQQVGPALFSVMERAQERVAAAESALTHVQHLCHEAAERQRESVVRQQAQVEQAWRQVEAALVECQAGGGGFRLFGGRSNRRLLRAFMEALSHFARQRLAEETTAAVRQFFLSLRGQLEERRRDLGFCRQRLRHLIETLEGTAGTEDDALVGTRPGSDNTPSHSPVPSTEAYWEAIRESATARVVLPDNEQDLERAAIHFLQSLTGEQWLQLDKDLHERVLLPRGGLHGACMSSGDLVRTLAVPLMDEAVSLLGQHLPIMDAAQILGAELGILADEKHPAGGGNAPELEAQSRSYLARTMPLLARQDGTGQHAFLLVPVSKAGKALALATKQVLPDLQEVKVPGQADLMFCRDQGQLGTHDLQRVFKACRLAYEAVATSPQVSPHARFDLTDWLPLDP